MPWFAWLSSSLAPFFVNPAIVAGGAALVSSPIIIHFINRMRYRKVRFAAMEFLLASQKRNRRRLLIEQLLLLLLRILIVIGLILLLGRMILDPSQLSIFEGSKAHHVVLLDDSGSMDDRWGETTAFAEAKEVVRKLVNEGAQRPQTQQFTLILLSNPAEEFFLQEDVDQQLVRTVNERFENLRPTHWQVDMARGLEAAGKFLAADKAGVKHLHVVSDFRKRDWDEERAIGAAVKTLGETGVAVNLIRAVPERHANLAISDLSGDTHIAAAGKPVWMSAKVRNYGEAAAENVRLALFQDGRKLPLSVGFDGKIEPGKEEERFFSVVFEEPGHHELEAQLEADALPGDNRRFLAVDVPEGYPALIIHGPQAQEDAETIEIALGSSSFQPIRRTPEFLRTEPLDRFRCVFLLDVPELAPDAIEPLKAYVAGGGGLIWYLGPSVRPAAYTTNLYAEGKGIFPVPLAGASAELPAEEDRTVPDILFGDHPSLVVYTADEGLVSQYVRLNQWLPVAPDWERDDNARADGVTTLAKLRTGDPLMFEHRYGEGRVFTCLTSSGSDWNNFVTGDVKEAFYILQWELTKHLAKSDGGDDARLVGEPIRLAMSRARYTGSVKIATPEAPTSPLSFDATRETARTDEEGDGGTSADAYRFEFPETDVPGVYVTKLLNVEQVEEERRIAFNVPAAEGNLELATTDLILKRVGDDAQVKVLEYGTFRDLFQGQDLGQEVRNGLLIALVLLLVAEQAMAYRLSYHPKTATAAA